jgi:hypothetical protein
LLLLRRLLLLLCRHLLRLLPLRCLRSGRDFGAACGGVGGCEVDEELNGTGVAYGGERGRE